MHDRHAVLPHRASSSIAALRSPSLTRQPVRVRPGASTSTKPTRPPRRFLSRCTAAATAARSIGGVERGRQALGGEQVGDLVAQLGLLGERQRGEQPEADRLAVAVALVGGDGLDRMPNRVAEVEGLAQAGVALVLGHDPQLDAGAGEHEVAVGRSAASRERTRRHRSPPAISPVLTTSAQPAASSCLRQRGERRRVGEHGRGLVVGADVVLALGEVDAGLAAVGGVDLGDQRGRHLHDRHAALVDGGAEARHVPHHAAAERDHVVVVAHAGRGQRAQHACWRSRRTCGARRAGSGCRARRRRGAPRRAGRPPRR